MTIKELRKKLKKLPQEATIGIFNPDDYIVLPIESIELNDLENGSEEEIQYIIS